jgi:hypothetical protein
MWQAMDDLSIPAFQADALFASAVQRCDEPDSDQVRQAIAAAIRAFGSIGCAERVAQEFGDHPETAVVRMRWARFVIGEAFPDWAPQPGLRPDADSPAGHSSPAARCGYIRSTGARRSERTGTLGGGKAGALIRPGGLPPGP